MITEEGGKMTASTDSSDKTTKTAAKIPAKESEATESKPNKSNVLHAIEVYATVTRIGETTLRPPFIIFKNEEASEEFEKQNPGHLMTNTIVSAEHYEKFYAKFEHLGPSGVMKIKINKTVA